MARQHSRDDCTKRQRGRASRCHVKTDRITPTMFILITVIVMFAAAVTLLVLRLVRPQFRFSWLIAVGATFLAWISVLFWRSLLPLSMSFGQWAPGGLLTSTPSLAAD